MNNRLRGVYLMDKADAATFSKARLMATDIIYEVTEKDAYANLALAKFLNNSSLNREDKKLVTEMVNGTIRMLKHLDWVLNLFLSQDIEKQHPWLRTVLRVSLYQILFMEKIPHYAIVNDAVALTRKKANDNLARVVNGVLRNILRNKENIKFPDKDKNITYYLSVYYSHPEWMVSLWLKEMSLDECIKLLSYNNIRPGVVLRTNFLKVSREKLIDELNKEGVLCHSGSLTPWDIEIKEMKTPLEDTHLYKEGYFYIQNPASMLAAPILDPKPGEKVYDLCSGVGGKTTHMAEIMQNQGRITAIDLYPQKIKLLKENCARLGINIAEGQVKDILAIEDMPDVDKVLLDAPCSGLGVLNRRADLRWKKKESDIAELASLQLKLLKKAGEMVKDGGMLLYSTCTVNRLENEEIIKEFLKDNRNFLLAGFDDKLDFFPLDNKDKMAAREGMLTIYPGKYNTDGMFYALMRRQKNN